MGKKDRRKKKNAGSTKYDRKEARRKENSGRPAGPKVDGTTRITGLGDVFDFTRGQPSCITTWDNLTKQEQYDLINLDKEDIKMAMNSELGDRVKLVKQPQPEEVRIYQAAFLQAMYTNQAFHEDDRGKIELPPDPSINNIFIFGALADRLLLWDSCRTTRRTTFWLVLFLVFSLCPIIVSSLFMILLNYIIHSNLAEFRALRNWYAKKCNEMCLQKFSREQIPVAWKIHWNMKSIVAAFVVMLKVQGGAACLVQVLLLFFLLSASSFSSGESKQLKTICKGLSMVNFGVLLLLSWSNTITLVFAIYVFFPTISVIVFRLYASCVAMLVSYLIKFLYAIAPKRCETIAQWIQKKNSRNIYYSLGILHVVLLIVYWKVWYWSYLPFGTLMRSFLIMVSFSSIPFTELIIIALVYMTWGADKVAKYFESYVVLYFSLHTRGKTAVEMAKKLWIV